MNDLQIDWDLLDEIEHRLELREPNRQAIESVAVMSSQHYDVDGHDGPFECIVDSATGVGKTYVMAGLVEYYAGVERPARNFLLLAPGRTIRDKSIQNFTAGHRKSLTGSMKSRPYLVTSENFASPATRAIMADSARTKLYVFTVQALTSSTGDGRETHEYQEGLGASFYKWLAGLDDLVVLADEQHCYRGPAFSKTIKELNPEVVVGLTATPAKADNALVVYRYPLARAIADEHVKTPVLVARKDDRTDDTTKLLDGVTLLKYKERLAHAYCGDRNLPPVNPVMLVIAQDIEQAEHFHNILDSESFDGGAWINKTLLVHSKLSGDEKENALAALDAVEHPDSPVRVIISVGMLKEGWDVKNVYVIASMRASVSDVLTEQTLGRGMRLPFGHYTREEMLDTVEVLAHEKYEALLAKREALNEKFIDHAVLAEIRRTADGQVVARKKIIDVPDKVLPTDGPTPDTGSERVNPSGGQGGDDDTLTRPGTSSSDASVRDLEDHLAAAAKMAERVTVEKRDHAPLPNRESISIPYVAHVAQQVTISLNQVHDEEPFRRLGATLTHDASSDLKRTLLKSEDGKIRGVRATGTVEALTLDIPLDTSRQGLVERVMKVRGVQRRATEMTAAGRLVDVVIGAMGDEAGLHLSAYFDRCARRLADTVAAQLKRVSVDHVTFSDEVRIAPLEKVRTVRKLHNTDHTETFDKATAYNGWKSNLYGYSWFDTSTEYKAAQAIDEGPNVAVWARLHRNDLPITWTQEGRDYNPDFVVVEEIDSKRLCWLVETKQNREMTSDEVVSKRRAAKTWANTVNSSGKAVGEWRYLLLSEDDVRDAGGYWEQMKGFGS
jgi:type III restriction enzyme